MKIVNPVEARANQSKFIDAVSASHELAVIVGKHVNAVLLAVDD